MFQDLQSTFLAVLAAGVLIACMQMVRKRTPNDMSFDQRNLLATNFGFFTTLYTFFLGFALATLWSSYNDASDNSTAEAHALVTTARISALLPDSAPLRQALADYARSVAEKEWATLESPTPDRQTAEVFQTVWSRALELKASTQAEVAYHLALLDRMKELGQHRAKRLDDALGQLYSPLWALIYMGLALTIVGFYFIETDHLVADLYYLLTMTAMILGTIFVLYELNNPFAGVLSIDPDPFVRAVKELSALR